MILEYGENFPLVAVRVANPGLVLQGVATFRFHFVARRQPALLPVLPHGQDLRSGGYLNTHVRQTAATRRGCFIQRQIQRRIGDVKFCVAAADLARFDAKQLSVKFHAPGNIADVNSHVSFEWTTRFLGHKFLLCRRNTYARTYVYSVSRLRISVKAYIMLAM